MTTKDESLDERVIRLEGSMDGMVKAVTGMEHTLGQMNDRLSGIGKPNWMLWISVAGVIITVFTLATGGLFYFMKSEIANRFTPLAEASRVSENDRHRLNDTAGRNSERIGDVNQRVMVNEAENRSNFTGVETQDRAIAQFANLRAAQQHQLIALLWEKAYGQKLPDVIYYPDISLNPHGK